MKPTDAYDLRRLKRSDLRCFRRIVETYHVQVYRYCFQFIRHREVVEEITSDVFLQLWKKRADLKSTGSISGLLFKIARDYAIDHLRKVARDQLLQESYLNDYQVSLRNTVEETINMREVLAMADEAVDRLPPKRRLVFRMRYREDLSNQQIAEILDISPHTVRVHLAKAARFIRSYLQSNSDIVFLLLGYGLVG